MNDLAFSFPLLGPRRPCDTDWAGVSARIEQDAATLGWEGPPTGRLYVDPHLPILGAPCSVVTVHLFRS